MEEEASYYWLNQTVMVKACTYAGLKGSKEAKCIVENLAWENFTFCPQAVAHKHPTFKTGQMVEFSLHISLQKLRMAVMSFLISTGYVFALMRIKEFVYRVSHNSLGRSLWLSPLPRERIPKTPLFSVCGNFWSVKDLMGSCLPNSLTLLENLLLLLAPTGALIVLMFYYSIRSARPLFEISSIFAIIFSFSFWELNADC